MLGFELEISDSDTISNLILVKCTTVPRRVYIIEDQVIIDLQQDATEYWNSLSDVITIP
jgi:hypothetical protein